jgi:hypothetical protein
MHNISEDILLSYRVLLMVFYAQICALGHALINYVTTKAKCPHLKILTCKGTLRQVSAELSFFFPFLETPNTVASYPMSVRHSWRNYQRRKAFISDFSIEKLKRTIKKFTPTEFFHHALANPCTM